MFYTYDSLLAVVILTALTVLPFPVSLLLLQYNF